MTMCTGADELVNTCNGSCYLTKQLTLVHDHGQEPDTQIPNNLKIKITFFSEEQQEESRQRPLINVLDYGLYFSAGLTPGYPSLVFQPPKYS